MAEDILGSNVGAALLAWSAMYGLHQYRWVCDNIRHFNLPLLYGEPMVGKTLIAMCGAWLVGCKESHIASRCTLAFVNSWLTKSTLPFVWDDPTGPEDVCQLAVDLANGAVRGKATEDAKMPIGACLVTANFDLQHMMKYFSRLLVIKIKKGKEEKRPGNAKILEDHAKMAAAALGPVLKELSCMNLEAVNTETELLQTMLPGADLRILEGIAFPLAVARLITNLSGRGHLMDEVSDYLEDVLIPYYKRCLAGLEVESATAGYQRSQMTFNAEIITPDNTAVVKGSEVAMQAKTMQQFLNGCNAVDTVKSLGGKCNKTVRVNGKPTKCLLLSKTCFKQELWQEILNRVFGLEEELDKENKEESLNEEEINSLNCTVELPPPPAAAPIDEDAMELSFDLPPPPAAAHMDEMEMSFEFPAPPTPFTKIGSPASQSMACVLPQGRQTGEPVQQNGEPVQQNGEPVQQNGEPGEPVQQTGEPVKHNGEPVQQNGEPGEPVQQTGEPVKHNGEPVQQNGEPVQQTGEPVKHNGEPVQQNGEPVQQTREAVSNLTDETHVKALAFDLVPKPAPSPGINKCNKCRKLGRQGALWIQCSTCIKWYHRACTTVTYKQFKELSEHSEWHCEQC